MRYSKSAFSLHSLWAKRLSAFIMCGSWRFWIASFAPSHFSIEFWNSCCCAAQNSMVMSATCLGLSHMVR